MTEHYPKLDLQSADPRVMEAVDALHDVEDPEVGINIVDLGLIYAVARDDGAVTVQMTLTSQGCPAGEYIMGGVRQRLTRLDGVASVDVDLVWDPPWSPEAISPEGREELGWD